MLSTKLAPSSPGGVIELSNEDEPEGQASSVAPAATAPVIFSAPIALVIPTALNTPGPSTPCDVSSPYTSRDEEIVRRLHVELNCEALGILRDGGLVILKSDSEEEITEEE